ARPRGVSAAAGHGAVRRKALARHAGYGVDVPQALLLAEGDQVQVDRRGLDVLVSQIQLKLPDVHAHRQKVRRVAVAKRVDRRLPAYARRNYGVMKGLLQRALAHRLNRAPHALASVPAAPAAR